MGTIGGTASKRWQYDLAGSVADYPDRAGAPNSTLLLCTQQRSGSTLLAEALYFAGGAGCALEYFHSGFRPSFAARWQAAALPDYIARLYRHRTDPSGMLAVKLFWSDVVALASELAPGRYDDLSAAAAREVDPEIYRDIHCLIAPIFPHPLHVRLIRNDKVAQAVSVSVAMQRRRWRQIDSADPAHRRDVTFRFAGIATTLARIQTHDAHWQRYLAANDIEAVEMSYEALAEDYDGEVRRVLRLIGRDAAAVRPPRMQKQGDAQSEDLARQFRAAFCALTRSSAS